MNEKKGKPSSRLAVFTQEWKRAREAEKVDAERAEQAALMKAKENECSQLDKALGPPGGAMKVGYVGKV